MKIEEKDDEKGETDDKVDEKKNRRNKRIRIKRKRGAKITTAKIENRLLQRKKEHMEMGKKDQVESDDPIAKMRKEEQTDNSGNVTKRRTRTKTSRRKMLQKRIGRGGDGRETYYEKIDMMAQ